MTILIMMVRNWSNIEGEICIRGYNVACEYLGLPKENKKSLLMDGSIVVIMKR